MMVRMLTLAGGITGAAACAQFPEFSQQYLQRLGGAVDALAEVVADFDASAQNVGLSRAEALGQMQGTAFLEARRADMTITFARFEALQRDLAALEGEGPFMRAYRLPHFSDRQIAKAAWAVYQPAVPLNFAGITFGVVGFALGSLGISLLLGVIRWPFVRRKPA